MSKTLFSRRLVEWAQEHHYTRAQTARSLGVSEQCLSRWIQGGKPSRSFRKRTMGILSGADQAFDTRTPVEKRGFRSTPVKPKKEDFEWADKGDDGLKMPGYQGEVTFEITTLEDVFAAVRKHGKIIVRTGGDAFEIRKATTV